MTPRVCGRCGGPTRPVVVLHKSGLVTSWPGCVWWRACLTGPFTAAGAAPRLTLVRPGR